MKRIPMLEDIVCIFCSKKFLESSDYKYPLKTDGIYHTSWIFVYDVCACPGCKDSLNNIYLLGYGGHDKDE